MNYEDPIVAEMRAVGDELARKTGYDVHLFCEMMRAHERDEEWRVLPPVTPVQDPLHKTHEV